MTLTATGAAPGEDFVARLVNQGRRRYHDQHPFHLAMHEGQLTPEQIQHWVRNRYYYQSRIPIKDALILAKSEEPSFRRMWLRRIREQDGSHAGEGGLALWLSLAQGVGLDPAEVAACRQIVPGVRFACDAYVESVSRWSLLEAVASSLTECFAPDVMATRIAAWERHYPWIPREAIGYFRQRVEAARRDADDAIAFVVARATTPEWQERCIAALVRKTEILWHLADSIQATCPAVSATRRPLLARKARLRRDPVTGEPLLVAPERGLLLNRSAAGILSLCTGQHTVAEIAQVLAPRAGAGLGEIARDVDAFVCALAARGLIEWNEP